MPESMGTESRPGSGGKDDQSLPSQEAHQLLATFSHFFTVCIHNVLFYRGIYPNRAFIKARAYNTPVNQCRHPTVCAWIRDAVDAAQAQIAQGTVERLVIVIYDAKSVVLERWMFDIAGFPAWGGLVKPKNRKLRPIGEGEGGGEGESGMSDEDIEQVDDGIKDGEPKRKEDAGDGGENNSNNTGDEHDDDDGNDATEDTEDEEADEEGDESEVGNQRRRKGAGRPKLDEETSEEINWTDVEEQLRAALRRLAYAGEKMAPLPKGCTYTLAIELRDNADAPMKQPQPWMPTKPTLQPASVGQRKAGLDIGGAKTTPVRAIEAGPLFFECWVEESKAKVELSTSTVSDS